MRTESELKAEIHRLIVERESLIVDIRKQYAAKLEPLREELKVARPKKIKLTTEQKYTEPDDAPVRTCKHCGGELLRATAANVERVERECEESSGEPRIYTYQTWVGLRHLRKDFCCYRCAHGREGHSCWCSLAHKDDEMHERLVQEVL